MAKNTNQKQNLVENYKKSIAEATGMYFFSGSLKASNTQTLRNAISGEARLTLIKNTLFNRAAKDAGIEISLDGYNNAVFVNESLIENAASLQKFLSENEFKPTFVVVGKSVYQGNKLKEISTLGSTNQVYGKLVGVMSMPTTMMVRALQSPMQKLAYVLSQVKPS